MIAKVEWRDVKERATAAVCSGVGGDEVSRAHGRHSAAGGAYSTG